MVKTKSHLCIFDFLLNTIIDLYRFYIEQQQKKKNVLEILANSVELCGVGITNWLGRIKRLIVLQG